MKKHLLTILCIVLSLKSANSQNNTNSTNLPADMIRIEASHVTIGNDQGFENEKPAFKTHIKAFLLDKNVVTVGQFRMFVKVNGYITEAEKKGEGLAYDQENNEWKSIAGANWEYPLGKDKEKAKNNEPVRQVSWNDAKAYATWLGKRLPSEFEMEYAMTQTEKTGIKMLDGSIWQWCETPYVKYDEGSYYKKVVLEKSIKGGSIIIDNQKISRPSLRDACVSDLATYQIGFRCAKNIE